MVLVRFAPSPTGPLHLGGLRMALYNHLFAKKNKGKWLLRIEDTDKSRYVPGSVEGIQKALEWAGLNYDYGPGRPGSHGPYFQSERLDLYKMYSNKLIESGHAYRCFCTPDTLAEVKEKLARSGSSSSYDRRCLHLTEEEVARKIRAGEKHTVRFNNTALPSRPDAVDLIFRNLKDAHASLATDPILMKSDLFPTYHLASVVDDHEMAITHVLRGEEWITSLPLHLDLYAALKITPPTFGHFPILLNPDGSKMSKRHGDIQVQDFIKRGWEPDAVLNWLLLCGYGVRHEARAEASSKGPPSHSDKVERNDALNLNQMVEYFDITSITQRNTILEASHLHYINKHHLLDKMRTEQGLKYLVGQVEGLVKEKFPTSSYTTPEMISQAILLLEGRLTNIYDLPELIPWLFEEPSKSAGLDKELEKALAQNPLTRTSVYARVVKRTLASLEGLKVGAGAKAEWGEIDFGNLLRGIRDEETEMKPRVVMKILRHALTGATEGPALGDTIRVLGRERTLKRLQSS